MPRVPENVAMDYHKAHLEAKKGGGAGAAAGVAKGGAAAAVGGAVGGVGAGPKLSQELQLYFTRLTKALLPGGGGEVAVAAAGKDGELTSVERARLAALASLRGDTGLQGLVVYLVRWIGEKVRSNISLFPVPGQLVARSRSRTNPDASILPSAWTRSTDHGVPPSSLGPPSSPRYHPRSPV